MLPYHLISVRGLARDMMDSLFEITDEMKEIVMNQGGSDSCKHKVAALYFCESSTRTSASFQAAIQRLGGSSVCVSPADSSMKKGESFPDTIQTLSSYCDVTIVRHPDRGSAWLASQHSKKPIINAGTGSSTAVAALATSNYIIVYIVDAYMFLRRRHWRASDSGSFGPVHHPGRAGQDWRSLGE
jgi:aspartate carbamoyltransferase catalytic subunit